ncbi:unnamed protein product [Calypogeia fissa]
MACPISLFILPELAATMATTLSMASSPIFCSSLNVIQTTRTSTTLSFVRHSCPTPGYLWKESAQASPRRRVGRARVALEDESSAGQETPTISSPPPPASPAVDKKAAAKVEIQKGQTTAIITGVISVLLGVGYLVLVQPLDTRGVNLVPPPPEAFDP